MINFDYNQVNREDTKIKNVVVLFQLNIPNDSLGTKSAYQGHSFIKSRYRERLNI